MFCFKIWSRFGVFRDPLTITQNLTFPVPPKTTVGGMLAAVLGMDYDDYFNDPGYFDFQYSLVMEKPVRKKSFAQNYVADYTKQSEAKNSAMKNFLKSREKYHELIKKKLQLEQRSDLSKKEEKFLSTAEKKIETEQKKYEKAEDKCTKSLNSSFRSPKPIFRELLIEPEYLVFIKDFKHENQIIPYLKDHLSAFLFYMGNTEFPANYKYLDCEWETRTSGKIDSFFSDPSNIVFEAGRKYTNIYMATRVTGKREYRDYRNFVLCDKSIRLKEEKTVNVLKCKEGEFNCDFV